MKGALRISRIAGIDIYLHWTFGLLIVGIFAFYVLHGVGVNAAMAGVLLVLAVFGCVVLHELGHALMARRFGVPTRDITLYPIGGVARLARIPEEPIQEFWIAVAGPAVNVLIATLLALVLWALGNSFDPEALVRPQGHFLTSLMWINLMLVGFNMLPAFPMDGGRVLRALLALHLNYVRATQIAANVGQGMAVLFGLFGLISFNPILLFIALFVYVGAQQEAQQAMFRALTQGIPVRQAMMTRFQVLHPDDSLAAAVEALLAGAEQDFPVVEDNQIVGVLTRKSLLRALAREGREGRVRDAMLPTCQPIEDTAMLEEAFLRMQETGCEAIPVVHNRQLVGLLTLENVGELMMISSALRQAEIGRSLGLQPLGKP